MSDELIHIGGVFLETELTKKLKKAIHNYRAIMPTKMRTLRYADEVWTPTGIVDSIRFEDIPIKEYNGCKKLEHNELCKYGPNIQKDGNYCKGCVFHTQCHKNRDMCHLLRVQDFFDRFQKSAWTQFLWQSKLLCSTHRSGADDQRFSA